MNWIYCEVLRLIKNHFFLIRNAINTAVAHFKMFFVSIISPWQYKLLH